MTRGSSVVWCNLLSMCSYWLCGTSASKQNTCVFAVSAAVSDIANGGQVLLEANTFHIVRNRLTELGTVDHRGYNDKLRASASRAVMKQQTSCLFSCLG